MLPTRLSTAVLTASLLAFPLAFTPALAGPATSQQATQASRQLAQLANYFHVSRAKFDPLLFATANGDPRYNDQIGMAISPSVRAKQFATYRQMQKRLAQIRLVLTNSLLKLKVAGQMLMLSSLHHL